MLRVLLHGLDIGTIEKEPSTNIYRFAMEEAYAMDPDRPVLGLKFQERLGDRVFRQTHHRGRLPSFFANLLPEGALEAIIASQNPGADEAAKLEILGEDLPGSVIVRPTDAGHEPVLDDRTFDEPPQQPAHMGELRMSLAGVQLKLSAVRDNDRFVIPAKGRGGRWILKFGSPSFPRLPENEFWTMTWAERVGLAVPRIELIASRSIQDIDERMANLDEYVFAIERFDRTATGERIQQEDFAQVKGVFPENKYHGASYEGLARLVGDVAGFDDLREMMSCVVFSILCANADAHLKNWSFVYNDQRSARLSPAYDIVCVRAYNVAENRLLAFPLAKERDMARIDWPHLRRVERYLREHGHDQHLVADAHQLVIRSMDVWSTLRHEVPADYRAVVDTHLQALPLVQGVNG